MEGRVGHVQGATIKAGGEYKRKGGSRDGAGGGRIKEGKTGKRNRHTSTGTFGGGGLNSRCGSLKSTQGKTITRMQQANEGGMSLKQQSQTPSG